MRSKEYDEELQAKYNTELSALAGKTVESAKALVIAWYIDNVTIKFTDGTVLELTGGGTTCGDDYVNYELAKKVESEIPKSEEVTK